MFHRWCRMLWSWAVPSLRHTFFFPSFWYRLILISAIQRMLFQKWSGFFRCFLSKSNLALFAACGEPCVFFWWSLLLIVDTSTSWRVFFSWLDVVKGFFFTMERILWSSTTGVLRGRPGLFIFWDHRCVLFLPMYQTVDLAAPNVPAISLMDVLFLKPNNRLFLLYGELLWPHYVGSQQQLPNANGTLNINSRPFTCLIDVEIMKE